MVQLLENHRKEVAEVVVCLPGTDLKVQPKIKIQEAARIISL